MKKNKVKYPWTDKDCEKFMGMLLNNNPPNSDSYVNQEQFFIVPVTLKASVRVYKKNGQYIAHVLEMLTSTKYITGSGHTVKSAVADLKLAIKETMEA